MGTRAVLIALGVFVLSGCGSELAPTSPTPTGTETSTLSLGRTSSQIGTLPGPSAPEPAPGADPSAPEPAPGAPGDAGGGGGVEITITPVPPNCSIASDLELVGYRLVQVRGTASPLPDPTGITADSTGFWVLNGGHNTDTHTLVHFNPATVVTDRTFTFTNLIEQKGTGVYGITYDGTSIWISVAGNTNKLVKVDPKSGQITRTMSSPTSLGPSDLDFDGRDLWLSSGTGDIFAIDTANGGVKKRYVTGPASLGRDRGIAARPGELWVGHLFGGMEIHNLATGEVIATARHADGSQIREEELGPTLFVGCQLVMASRYGVRTFDTVATVRTRR